MEIDHVKKFVSDAVADGWIATPTYDHESIERATTLQKDGFQMSCLMRPKSERFNAEAMIVIWGPDALGIRVPETYSMQKIKEGLKICGECGAEGVETARVAFANRVCKKCYSGAKAKYEKPGWCD